VDTGRFVSTVGWIHAKEENYMPTRTTVAVHVPANGYSPIHLSDEQRDLAVSHLSLIGVIAKDIGSKVATPIPFDELVSVGAGALIDAALHYHPENEVPFGIYARRSIRGAIMAYLNQSALLGPTERLLA
jgi:DNA-directed RNA polymerase sigma subunit (sigma70/sigma32)